MPAGDRGGGPTAPDDARAGGRGRIENRDRPALVERRRGPGRSRGIEEGVEEAPACDLPTSAAGIERGGPLERPGTSEGSCFDQLLHAVHRLAGSSGPGADSSLDSPSGEGVEAFEGPRASRRPSVRRRPPRAGRRPSPCVLRTWKAVGGSLGEPSGTGRPAWALDALDAPSLTKFRRRRLPKRVGDVALGTEADGDRERAPPSSQSIVDPCTGGRPSSRSSGRGPGGGPSRRGPTSWSIGPREALRARGSPVLPPSGRKPVAGAELDDGGGGKAKMMAPRIARERLHGAFPKPTSFGPRQGPVGSAEFPILSAERRPSPFSGRVPPKPLPRPPLPRLSRRSLWSKRKWCSTSAHDGPASARASEAGPEAWTIAHQGSPWSSSGR